MAEPAENSGAKRRSDGMPVGTPFKSGGGSPNPGGRPKKLVEIERMLDDDHRTVDNMREVFARLKALALGEVVEVPIPGGEGETRIELRAEPAFMKLYLERTLGPLKDLEPDLGDAPQEVLRWLAEHAN